MYRTITNIKIEQQASNSFPNRNSILEFDFSNNYTCTDSVDDLTNKGTVTLPRNVYVRDSFGKIISLGNQVGKKISTVNIGGFSSNAPLLLRGDKVSISYGYKYLSVGRKEVLNVSQIFTGFISKVLSTNLLEFEVEDNMWKLKQIQAPIKSFNSSETLESILTYLLKGTSFTVNALTKTSIGAFMTGNETVCEVLSRLRKLYNFSSYFRGNELRSGATSYIESESVDHTFTFNQDIISDDLEYSRKDDVILSAIAHNTITEETGSTTKDGQKKTKKTRLEVLVTIKNNAVTSFIKTKDKSYPENEGGERREFIFLGATTITELISLATANLQKYYFEGFKGSFLTFGIPYVKTGDNVQMVDNLLPERNGVYKVKKVDYSGGVNGLRQNIKLDYKIQ